MLPRHYQGQRGHHDRAHRPTSPYPPHRQQSHASQIAANTARMHERNPYRGRVFDLDALSTAFPPLRRYVYKLPTAKHRTPSSSSGPGTMLSTQVMHQSRPTHAMNFHDVNAVRELTRALLFVDYRLDVDLPVDTLTPAVPGRLNYLLWIEDLLQATAGLDLTRDRVHGIDVGCGASCVYALLGCRMHPETWSFTVTDIQPRSIDYARRNVERNALTPQIQVIHNQDASEAFPDMVFNSIESDDAAVELDAPEYWFTMSNPPFYASTAHIVASQAAKSTPAVSRCTGNHEEMVVTSDGANGDGSGAGEVALIRRMIDDGRRAVAAGSGHARRVVWWTSLVGIKSDVGEVVRYLDEMRKDNNKSVGDNDDGLPPIIDVRTTSLYSGQTLRWAVAWRIALPHAKSDGV